MSVFAASIMPPMQETAVAPLGENTDANVVETAKRKSKDAQAAAIEQPAPASDAANDESPGKK